MRFFYKRALFSVSLFAALSLLAGIDFSTESPRIRSRKEYVKNEQSAVYEKEPLKGTLAMKLSWNELKAPYMEVSFLEPELLPEFRKIEFKIRTGTKEKTAVKAFHLRLIDAKGEIFQFKKPVFWNKSGEWETVFTVCSDPLNTKSIWGGDKNRKIDFPVRLLGFSIHFIKNSGKGEFYINSIVWRKEEEKDTGRTVMANMAKPLLDRKQNRLLFDNCHFEFTGDTSGRLRFKTEKKNSFALNFCLPGPMGAGGNAPCVPKFKKAVLLLEITADAPLPVQRITAGFLDNSSGRQKIHRFTRNVSFKKAGKQIVRIPVGDTDKNGAPLPLPLRLAGLTFRAPEGMQGNFSIDKLTLCDMEILPENALRLDLESKNRIHVMKPGEVPAIILANLLNIPVAGMLKLQMFDFNRNPLEWSVRKKISFQPGERFIFHPELPEKSNIWYVEAEFSPDGKTASTVRLCRSFVTMNPTGATPGIKKPQGFVFGINSHPERFPNDLEREADAIALAGGKLVRFVVPRQLELLDEIVRIFQERGISFDLIFSYESRSKKIDYEASREYYRKLFSRYRGKIFGWELLNEPDIHKNAPSVGEYIRLAGIAREELDRADPDAKLLSAGFCAFDFPGRGKFQRDAMAGAGNVFHLHCFHGHAPFSTYSEITIDRLFLGMRREAGITLPWYSNETALTSANRTEKEQAFALFKKLLFAWSRGTVGYNWYNLRDKGENPTGNEHNYGMFTYDFYPKAVYPVFNTLTALYRGKCFVRQFKLPPSFFAFELKDEKETILAGWSENYSTLPLLIRSDAKSAELVDLMGNAVPVERQENCFLLPLSENPCSLRLRGASFAEVLPQAVNVVSPEILIPGKAVPLRLSLKNTTAKPQEIALELSAPAGIVFGTDKIRLKLPMGKTVQWETKLAVSPDYPIRYGEKVPLNVNYSIDGKHPVRFILPQEIALPVDEKFPEKPLFVLDRKEQVAAFYDLDPVRLDMHWLGPEDLSAKVWLAVLEKSFKIRVLVKDDKHYQPYEKAGAVQGDSVQLTFKSPAHPLPCELDFFRTNDGGNHVFIRWTPPGLDIDRDAAAKQIRLETFRREKETEYMMEIPFGPFGIDRSSLCRGFYFNLLVNDNDGKGRKGWIRIAPGIGNGIHFVQHPFLILK